MKQQDVTFIREDGVKVTMCVPRVTKRQALNWATEKPKGNSTYGTKKYAQSNLVQR